MKQSAGNPNRRNKVMDFIVKFKMQNNGDSPTLREIGNACDISSPSVVSYYLQALAKDGLLEGYKDGHIHVVGGKWIPPEHLAV